MNTSFNSQYVGIGPSSAGPETIPRDRIFLTDTPDMLGSCVRGTIRHRLRPYPLSEVHDLKVQQGLIIKDLLFSLLGLEGCYIRFSDKYLPDDIDQRIEGPDFKIAKHLDVSLKSITKKLIRYGKYYSGLLAFIEYYDNKRYGTVVQNLCFRILEFLVQYQKVIVKIEDDFTFNSRFNLALLETYLNQEVSNKLVHLYEIVIEVHETSLTRQLKAAEERANSANPHIVSDEDFLSDVRKTLLLGSNFMMETNSESLECCKGGLVLQIVQRRITKYKGDLISLEFLIALFDSISENYVQMLNDWLINGDINDQFDEFMVKEKKVPSNLLDVFSTRGEHYWNELFVIRSDGLIDQFQDVDLQNKVLSTGKYLNVFKKCTGLHDFSTLGETIKPITKIYSLDFELKISEFYRRANKLLLKMLFEGYDLLALVKNFQSIFLFSDSFKVDNFLNKSFYDLKRNRHAISLHKLKKFFTECYVTSPSDSPTSIADIVENNQHFLVTTTNFYDVVKEIMNVQTFDADEILNHESGFNAFVTNALQRLSAPNSAEYSQGYDRNHSDNYAVASLDLSVDLPFPLNLIINRELSYHYELMFKLQMLVKFINKFNDITWKEINHSAVWKYRGFEPRFKKWILRCRVLHKRMRDFLNELQIYLNYDVVDNNYLSLEKKLADMQASLRAEQLGSDINHETNSVNNYSAPTNQINNIFNRRMQSAGRGKSMYQRHLENGHNKKDDVLIVDHLIQNLSEFLNTLITDSLITKPALLNVLKNMFDMIILFNNYLNRLKKVLILCSPHLFEKFSADYPDKFNDKSMDIELIDNRYENLNTSLKDYYEIFGDSLTEFIVTLKAFGELENKKILLLSESLEKCFPEQES